MRAFRIVVKEEVFIRHRGIIAIRKDEGLVLDPTDYARRGFAAAHGGKAAIHVALESVPGAIATGSIRVFRTPHFVNTPLPSCVLTGVDFNILPKCISVTGFRRLAILREWTVNSACVEINDLALCSKPQDVDNDSTNGSWFLPMKRWKTR